MRIDTDTYVWGVKRILIERRTDGDNDRTRICFVDEFGEVATATLCVWGVGQSGSYQLPEIALVEGGAEPRVIAPPPEPEPEPKAELVCIDGMWRKFGTEA